MASLTAKLIGSALSPAGRRGRLLAFNYHQVLDKPDPFRPDEPTAEEFRNDLEIIASTFTVLSPADALSGLVEGELPPRAACITFDDGYLNNLKIAAPLLCNTGLPAAFYIACDAIDTGIMWNDLVIETLKRTPSPSVASLISIDVSQRELPQGPTAVGYILKRLKYVPLDARWKIATDFFVENCGDARPRLMMTQDELQDLAGLGFEVGAHTISHPILTTLETEDGRREIAGSRRILNDWLGKPPVTFAYPNGKPEVDFSAEHANLVREAGFLGAFSTEWAAAKPQSDRYSVPRIGPWWRHGEGLSQGLAKLYLRTYF